MNNLFLKKFHGQFVQIITKLSMLTDHGPAPLIETGFVVDMDNSFLYLGSADPLNITKSIAISEIAMVDTEMPDASEEKILLNDFNEDNGDLN